MLTLHWNCINTSILQDALNGSLDGKVLSYPWGW